MLLRVMPSKPRSRAMASRSNGKPLPASAPEPSGSTLARRARFAEALPIAREHLEVRQQVVRPEHRLRAAHVRVAGDHRVGILRRRDRAAPCMTPPSSARARSHSSRSHSRVSSETCSLRLRPVWILSATRAGALLQLADDQRVDVFVGRAVVEAGDRRLRRGSHRRPSTICARSSAVRMPTRSSARANACEPRISASISRRSKWSEPEKRSKTSEGPVSNRPPQSFMLRLLRAPASAQRPHLHRQPDQVDEAERVLLVVARRPW